MKNQAGASIISLATATVLLATLTTATISAVNNSNDVVGEAQNAQVQMAHAEVNEQFELNHQVYYIEKSTGEYKGNLMDYLKSEGFVDEEGSVNMSKLLGNREERIPTGKGSSGKDVYTAEADESSENDVKLMYYDENGEPLQIGKLYGSVQQ